MFSLGSIFFTQLREMYATAISNNITSKPAYQECMKFLQFQAKNELIEKLEKVT